MEIVCLDSEPLKSLLYSTGGKANGNRCGVIFFSTVYSHLKLKLFVMKIRNYRSLNTLAVICHTSGSILDIAQENRH